MFKANTKNVVIDYIPSGIMSANIGVIIDKDTNQAVLVDAGGPLDEVMPILKKNGNPEVIAILITHGHADHIFSASTNKQFLPNHPKLYLGEDDLPLWNKFPEQLDDFGFGAFAFKLPPPDVLVHDKDEFFEGNLKVQCISIPGHSPGSICYYFPNIDLVCCGDVLFKRSVGRTDWSSVPSLDGTGDFDQLITGIKTKLLTLPRTVDIIPGHGDHTSVGYEILYNPYARNH